MVEKKYIELQKALNVCEMHYEHCLEMHDWSGDATADNIKRDIETLPTADVVEVVRCKDCKYYCLSDFRRPEEDRWCEQICNGNYFPEPTDFCSCGERRTDNDL